MSPNSQYLNTSIISLNIVIVVELENVLDEIHIVDFIRNVCVPSNARFSLVVPVPCISGEQKVDPLYFVTKAKDIMERKKNSFFTYLINPFTKVLTRIKGPKGVAECLYKKFWNTTASVTSLIGPNEKMGMAGHPIGSCYFIVAGVPQSLTFTVASWMGQLRLTTTMEKNFIDSQLFNSCMKEAFETYFTQPVVVNKFLKRLRTFVDIASNPKISNYNSFGFYALSEDI